MKQMHVTDCNDMTLSVNLALNPNTTNQPASAQSVQDEGVEILAICRCFFMTKGHSMQRYSQLFGQTDLWIHHDVMPFYDVSCLLEHASLALT